MCHTSSINSLLVNNEQVTALSNNGYIAVIDYTLLDDDPTCTDPQVNVIQNADKISILNAAALSIEILSAFCITFTCGSVHVGSSSNKV